MIHLIFKWIYRSCIFIFSYLFRIFPIKDNRIIISNYYGKGYGDNGKYICEQLLQMDENLEIVWLINKNQNTLSFNSKIKIVKNKSIKGLYYLCTSKVWIDNCRKHFYSYKRKNQFYIQTWHGAIPLKKIEKDAESKLSKDYVKNAKLDSKLMDALISNGTFSTRIMKQSFWFDGPIYEYGSPRCDVLFSDVNRKNRIKEKISIDKKYKILLYAPTFRKDMSVEIYKLNFDKILQVLKNKTEKDWIIFVRMHPNLNKNIEINNQNVINMSNYDDMYELMLISDILITDYSSSMFEFMFTKKPVFLYAPDINDYLDDRGFYFEFEELPFPKAFNFEDLLRKLTLFDNNKYIYSIEEFIKKIGCFEDGKASERVANLILKKVYKNEN